MNPQLVCALSVINPQDHGAAFCNIFKTEKSTIKVIRSLPFGPGFEIRLIFYYTQRNS